MNKSTTKYPFSDSRIQLRYRDPDTILNLLLLFWIAILASRQYFSVHATVYLSEWLLAVGVPIFLASALALAPTARSHTGRLMQRAMVLATGLSTFSVEIQPLLISAIPWLLAACVILRKGWDPRHGTSAN